MLLALFCLLCKYVTRERITSGSRSAINHLSKNICISVYVSWMCSLTCFSAQSPQQLCQHKGRWVDKRGGQDLCQVVVACSLVKLQTMDHPVSVLWGIFRKSLFFLALQDFHSLKWNLKNQSKALHENPAICKWLGTERWTQSKQALLLRSCAVQHPREYSCSFSHCISVGIKGLSIPSGQEVPKSCKKGFEFPTHLSLLIWQTLGCCVIYECQIGLWYHFTMWECTCVALVNTEEPFAELLFRGGEGDDAVHGTISQPRVPLLLLLTQLILIFETAHCGQRGYPKVWPSVLHCLLTTCKQIWRFYRLISVFFFNTLPMPLL